MADILLGSETMGSTPEGFLLAPVASIANERQSRWVGFHGYLNFSCAVYQMGHHCIWGRMVLIVCSCLAQAGHLTSLAVGPIREGQCLCP